VGEPIKQRGLASLIIFSILTLGIYSLYWNHKLAKDVNIMCEGDGEHTSGLLKYILLGIITFGIYWVIWQFMLGDRLYHNAPRYGLSFKEGGGTIVLWDTLGIFILIGPYIALYIIIRNVNALAQQYNKRFEQQALQ